MLKKVLLVVWWFPICLFFLINNFIILNQAQKGDSLSKIAKEKLIADNQVHFLSDRGTGKVLAATITAGDGRLDLLNDFMKGSPMFPYANIVIREADKYGIDYRLVPAIAMCESNLGVHIPSSDSYNAWGIAVFTGQQHGAKFSNWEQAIVWVNKYLNDKFISRNIIDINDIGAIWAPPSVEKGNSWANCVSGFMRQIQ
jgi:hypothetical protein